MEQINLFTKEKSNDWKWTMQKTKHLNCVVKH